MSGAAPVVRFEAKLLLTFGLPGCDYRGGSSTGGRSPLEQRMDHTYNLEVSVDTAKETAAAFRAVADEIDRYLAVLK